MLMCVIKMKKEKKRKFSFSNLLNTTVRQKKENPLINFYTFKARFRSRSLDLDPTFFNSQTKSYFILDLDMQTKQANVKKKSSFLSL